MWAYGFIGGNLLVISYYCCTCSRFQTGKTVSKTVFKTFQNPVSNSRLHLNQPKIPFLEVPSAFFSPTHYSLLIETLY